MVRQISKDEERMIVQAAMDARERAYCPYSGFRVGACLLSGNGRLITGCNVENASYGACICAERTAIVKAISEGHKEFLGIAICGSNKGACLPCGICRQFLSELCDAEMAVFLPDGEAPQDSGPDEEPAVERTTLGELLPRAFAL